MDTREIPILHDLIPPYLKCPVCLDVLCDPRMMPCSHTVCCACLDNLARFSQERPTNNRPGKVVSCPVCRRKLMITLADKLLQNRGLADAVSDWKERVMKTRLEWFSSKIRTCRYHSGSETTNIANLWCNDCQHNICSTCKDEGEHTDHHIENIPNLEYFCSERALVLNDCFNAHDRLTEVTSRVQVIQNRESSIADSQNKWLRNVNVQEERAHRIISEKFRSVRETGTKMVTDELVALVKQRSAGLQMLDMMGTSFSNVASFMHTNTQFQADNIEYDCLVPAMDNYLEMTKKGAQWCLVDFSRSMNAPLMRVCEAIDHLQAANNSRRNYGPSNQQGSPRGRGHRGARHSRISQHLPPQPRRLMPQGIPLIPLQQHNQNGQFHQHTDQQERIPGAQQDHAQQRNVQHDTTQQGGARQNNGQHDSIQRNNIQQGGAQQVQAMDLSIRTVSNSAINGNGVVDASPLASTHATTVRHASIVEMWPSRGEAQNFWGQSGLTENQQQTAEDALGLIIRTVAMGNEFTNSTASPTTSSTVTSRQGESPMNSSGANTTTFQSIVGSTMSTGQLLQGAQNHPSPNHLHPEQSPNHPPAAAAAAGSTVGLANMQTTDSDSPLYLTRPLMQQPSTSSLGIAPTPGFETALNRWLQSDSSWGEITLPGLDGETHSESNLEASATVGSHYTVPAQQQLVETLDIDVRNIPLPNGPQSLPNTSIFEHGSETTEAMQSSTSGQYWNQSENLGGGPNETRQAAPRRRYANQNGNNSGTGVDLTSVDRANFLWGMNSLGYENDHTYYLHGDGEEPLTYDDDLELDTSPPRDLQQWDSQVPGGRDGQVQTSLLGLLLNNQYGARNNIHLQRTRYPEISRRLSTARGSVYGRRRGMRRISGIEPLVPSTYHRGQGRVSGLASDDAEDVAAPDGYESESDEHPEMLETHL